MNRPSSRRTVGVVGAAALATALVLAGCGGGDDPVVSASPTPSTTSATSATSTATAAPTTSSSPSPSSSEAETAPTVAEVYRAARTSALSAASGHARGTQTRDRRTLTIDVEGVANGSNQTVFITSADGGTAEVLTVGDRYWLGGDRAFWVEQTGDTKAGTAMVGAYVLIAESDATELGSFTLRSILSEKFALPEFAALESDTTPAKGTEVDGRAAYLLRGAGGARLWVAADGGGALLRAVGPRTAPSDLVFSDWDRAKTFSPPPASKVAAEG